MDQAVDDIRGRYGNDIMKRAVLMEGNVDHMEGGISREKRAVNYERIRIE